MSRSSLLARSAVTGAAVATTLAAATLTAGAAPVPYPTKPQPGMAVNGVVRAVVLGDGIAYVGGDFTSATGTNGNFSRGHVAAFDTRTGAVTGFRADAAATVRALALGGGSLYVGGDFTQLGGQSRSRLAAVDATTGAVRSDFRLGASSAVRALALSGQRLYVGGQFTSFASVSQARVAAVNLATRTVDTGFRPALDGTVQALAVAPAGGDVYVGGDFTHVSGLSRPYLARVRENGSVGTSFAVSSNYNVQALDTNDSGSRVYVAHGGAGNQAAAFDTTSGARLWRQRADGDVQAITYQGGNVYFGFHEGFEGNTSLRLLAADATTGRLETSFQPPVNSFFGIRALDATPAGLLAGGEFTTIDGVAAGRAAFFSATSGGGGGGGGGSAQELVASGATWRYDDGAAEPTGWRSASYDDAGWASGAAQLGYGDGDESTVISYGPDAAHKRTAAYFRTSFSWSGTPAASLSAGLLADDGAVVYLNGQEVVRDNMPGGTVSYSTLAASNRSGSAEQVTRQFALDPALLVSGRNVIAVEVHQDARSSSDLSFQLALRATTG